MKNSFSLGLVLCLLAVSVLSGCGGGNSASDNSTPLVVVFCKAGSEGGSQIYKQNLDGSGGTILVSPAAGDYTYPVLSHDQKKVAFIGGDARYLYVVSINHNGAVLPEPLVDAGSASISYPAFSKDGTRIAYRVYSTVSSISGIYVADTATGDKVKISHCPANARHPSWSPDGSLIVYEYENNIYTINSSDTSDSALLLSGARYPCWSPGDNRIAFYDVTEEGIGLITYGGSGSVTPLMEDVEDEESRPGYWSPDGTRLILERYFSAQNQSDILALRLSDKTETNITHTTAAGEYESLYTLK